MEVRILRLVVVFALLSIMFVRGQGVINFSNILPGGGDVATRIGDLNGPLVGREYNAQLLAGRNESSLDPVGMPVRHIIEGLFSGGTRSIPGIMAGQDAVVQVAAWNGELWGDDFTQVPTENIGFSDTAIVMLDIVNTTRPLPSLRITQPAIVPIIPEPSTMRLMLMAAVLAFALYVARSRRFKQVKSQSFSGPIAE